MAFYHASQVKGITELEPRISNHDIPLIYFSDKRENVLVYLSNAVEKVCKEAGFAYTGSWYKWGPYGFEKDGRLRLEEYYPDALEDTYKGVQGYIYSCNEIMLNDEIDIKIPNAYVSSQKTLVDSCEVVPDAYDAIIKAEREGKITILRYDAFIQNRQREAWLRSITLEEYENSAEHPEYRFFLKTKFSDILR